MVPRKDLEERLSYLSETDNDNRLWVYFKAFGSLPRK